MNSSIVTISLSKIVIFSPSAGELFKLSIGYRLNILKYNPLDALSARRSGKGTIISIVLLEVLLTNEVRNINIINVNNSGAASRLGDI